MSDEDNGIEFGAERIPDFGERIKRQLFDLGHFRNPAMPTNVSAVADLPGLSLTSEAVKQAVRSYQEMMAADFDRISLEQHGRPGIADGEIGPATAALFDVPRCQCPDYGDDVELATGSGSWPAGCTAEYPDNHTFAIYWDKSRMPSFLAPVIDECIARCYAAYRDIGIVFITTPSRSSAQTIVTWQRGNGWIGLAIVGQNQRCNSQIWAKFDTVYRPSRLVDQWSRLLAHEFGHNMGLRHSRGGIMNPSISSGVFDNNEWRGDPSEPILRRWFGGVPVPPRDAPDDPDEPDPPNNDEVAIRGDLSVEVNGVSYEFILTPKPGV